MAREQVLVRRTVRGGCRVLCAVRRGPGRMQQVSSGSDLRLGEGRLSAVRIPPPRDSGGSTQAASGCTERQRQRQRQRQGQRQSERQRESRQSRGCTLLRYKQRDGSVEQSRSCAVLAYRHSFPDRSIHPGAAFVTMIRVPSCMHTPSMAMQSCSSFCS